MREPVRDRERLEHIVESIINILDFTDGKTKDGSQQADLLWHSQEHRDYR